MGDDKPQCVKVAIRMRPPSQKEINAGEAGIVELREAFGPDADPGQVVLSDPSGAEEPSTFAFDIVFGLTIQQVQVYENIGRPALMKTFEGYNGTIFAYGQTGSGKSWSMAGAPTPELRGITPRVNEELFLQIKDMVASSTRRFLVMCSYFEIYNEIIFDLLNPVQDRSKLGGGLQVKEHPVLGIYVKDLTEIVAEDAKKLEDMLDNGMKARAVSSTMMNSVSSRSHSVFTIKIHQKDEEDKSKNIFAKLNLVDLAGSERQKGTGATGQTLKEGANINKSLSALGNVINALVECANGKKVFIPYRNSKLTRVLQESLGGNSLCSMLATLSPAACNYEETMSTLRYANRAKAIKVSATKNEEASQISRLKAEVEELKKKVANAGGGGGAVGLSEDERQAEKDKFEKQLKEMEKMMSDDWSDKAKLSEEHERKIQKIAEDRRKAAQAVDEERTRRLRLLQEKNDLELSIRGLIDLCTHLPKLENPPPLLTGEQPRLWLKTLRSLRQHVDELKEQRTMVLVFKHAFDEDVKLVGEGAEANDLTTTGYGLNRCMPKLDKLRKGGEKFAQLEGSSLATASELSDAVRQASSELEKFQQTLTEEAEEANDSEGVSAEGSAGKAKRSAIEEVSRMLSLVQKQVQEKTDELEQLAAVDMGQTCDVVLHSSNSCLKGGGSGPAAEEAKRSCEALQGVLADPTLAALPAGMPSKPLHEYVPTDALDTPESTEAVLGQIIRWEGLCARSKKSAADLLARPPPRFILDVTLAVKAATGFPADVEDDWPEEREARLARFNQIASAVGAVLGVQPDFDPTDVLKGKGVPKTLRLMQLLAIAAARQQPAPPASKPAVAPSAAPRQTGSIRPRELPSMLDAVSRCLEAAKAQVDAKRAEAEAAAQGERSLEEKISALQAQLQEENVNRLRQEEALADAERQLQESRSEVKKISNEVELTEATNPEQLELEKQVAGLQTASPSDLPDGEVLRMLKAQVEEVRTALQQAEGDVTEMEEKQQELAAAVRESEMHQRQLEAEAQRERQRRETEQQLMGQSPEEQKLILEAHEQKLRTKCETLEAQIVQMQAEAEERVASNQRLGQETHELQAKADDAHLQMQIVAEERDAMREAMEQLWTEKSTVDEELQNLNQSYVNLTESLTTQEAEFFDLESLVEQRRQEVAGLQKNGFHMLCGGSGSGALPAVAS
mmetsp:Transcript_32302/g.74920  ORF Transcript_32302/g.74920 Transcript_32302/m.74920 type:complete len:1189 (+) Transcript_32302:78-3644(+)